MQNKTTAMKKLQNILYQNEFNKDMSAISKDRKFQVGNMNRNEKIRTYNFSRHMVTDHRLGSSVTVRKAIYQLKSESCEVTDWFLH